MPYGLKNDPETVQHARTSYTLRPNASSPWFLDDIVVFSRTPAEHIDSALQVLMFVRDVHLTLNMRKCEFITYHIDYLGHVICPGRLRSVDTGN